MSTDPLISHVEQSTGWTYDGPTTLGHRFIDNDGVAVEMTTAQMREWIRHAAPSAWGPGVLETFTDRTS